jgi:drug/metabolite transporter (DMT)-like permease
MMKFRPVLDQNLYYMGSNLTSAGFSSALVNILPTVTFIMALVLRMVKVRLRSVHSQAKVIGALFTVVGAVLMIMYHGPVVPLPWTKAQLHVSAATAAQGGGAAWLKGTIAIVVGCVAWSGFFVLQSNTLQSYPAELTLTALICGMGSLMGGAVALVAERGNNKAWVIGFDTRLFTAVYAVSHSTSYPFMRTAIYNVVHRLNSLTLATIEPCTCVQGIVCSGVAYYVQGLVSRQRGPVFVTAFNPLCMIVTALLGSVILKEEIRLGRYEHTVVARLISFC